MPRATAQGGAAPNNATAQLQLDGFIDKYAPAIAAQARDALAQLRRKLPGAFELVYDNYNALAIGFGPSERTSEAIFSLVLYPRWISLFFLHGVGLPDPAGLLRGSGTQVRHIVLSDTNLLRSEPVRQLIDAALAQARVPLPPNGTGHLVIKSISTRQRPRRP